MNSYIDAQTLAQANYITILSWNIISFLSNLLAGKLKSLNHYLPQKDKNEGKTIVKSYKQELIDKAIVKAKQLGHL